MDDTQTKPPVGDEATAQAEADRKAAAEKEAARQAALAEFNNHPHTQLSAVLKDLQAPHGDLHDRIGAVQRGLSRLVQVALAGVQPPRHPEDDSGREQEQLDAGGADGKVSARK